MKQLSHDLNPLRCHTLAVLAAIAFALLVAAPCCAAQAQPGQSATNPNGDYAGALGPMGRIVLHFAPSGLTLDSPSRHVAGIRRATTFASRAARSASLFSRCAPMWRGSYVAADGALVGTWFQGDGPAQLRPVACGLSREKGATRDETFRLLSKSICAGCSSLKRLFANRRCRTTRSFCASTLPLRILLSLRTTCTIRFARWVLTSEQLDLLWPTGLALSSLSPMAW